MTSPVSPSGSHLDLTVHDDMAAHTAAPLVEAHHHYDEWLDEVAEPTHPLYGRATQRLFVWFAGPSRLIRKAMAFIITTPGKMTAVMVLLTFAIAAAGMSMANFSSLRHERLDVLLTSTEPMNSAAHNLYTSLSLADTVASTGFVQAGSTLDSTRATYNEAIDRAALAANQSIVGTDADDTHIRELVALIQRRLPVYTGLVEQARANHRADNAVAVTYMTTASELMRGEILPAAGELFQLTSAKVASQEHELTAPQLVPISGFLAAVAFLLAAQWWLWRLTRRRFNHGFVASTALMLFALVWVITANTLTYAAGGQRFAAAAAPWEQLTNSQIAAQQARTSETLMLVNRQTSAEYDASFETMVGAVTQALDSVEPAVREQPKERKTLADARKSLEEWQRAHDKLTRSLQAGDYETAITQATGTVGPTATTAFSALNDSLTSLIANTREVMRSYINESLKANRALGGGVGLLTIGAIIAIWVGIRRRLQEYL